MITSQTFFNVTDNSGAKYAKCFKISKYSDRKIGGLIYVVVKGVKNSQKLKEGLVTKGIIVRTNFTFNKLNGNFITFNTNDIVLMNNKEEFFCTRIFGPLILELRKKQKIRILSIGIKLV